MYVHRNARGIIAIDYAENRDQNTEYSVELQVFRYRVTAAIVRASQRNAT